MYLQEILEVGIGLVFVWLVLAIACMAVQEWLSGLLKMRAKDLEKSIQGILDDPELAKEFYRHPLIKGLSKPAKEIILAEDVGNKLRRWAVNWLNKRRKSRAKPSYIPKDTFARVIFDMAMTAGTDTSTLTETIEGMRKQISEEAEEKLDQILEEIKDTSYQVAKNKLEKLASENPTLSPYVDAILLLASTIDDEALKQLRRGITTWAIHKPQVARALHSLTVGIETSVKKGENALAKARTNLEEYFDQAMDRLTGVYKRRSQLWGLIIGIVLAVAFNVDSVMIGTILWKEPTIRAVFIEKAEKIEMPKEIESEDPESAWQDFEAQFQGLDLPLGWDIEGKFKPMDLSESEVEWGWGVGLSKCMGWIISGAAAAQGAPFWFDILKNLTNIRSAGIKPGEKEDREKREG